MNARFAEPCRAVPLDLMPIEGAFEQESVRDGKTQKEMLLKCDQDIFIGVFFDGTNNNKYRDTASMSQSNVARLYEVYPGTHAEQTPPICHQKN
jgi:hypothetical protein